MAELTKLSQGELAYSRLYEAISKGDFLPGDRLREAEIADQLNISRTPIREALRRLEADGIVEHRARIGAVIRQLGHGEVVELYEMRAVLERTAAQMAAKHALQAETEEMEALNAEIEAAGTQPHRAAAINQQFHRCLYLATRNRFLLGSTRALTNAMLLLGRTTLGDEDRVRIVCAQHAQIIDAIRQGDVERAGSAAEEHLKTSLRHRLMTMRT